MKPEARARVLEAAKRGWISFYERDTHEEIEFDTATGEPVPVLYEHGVCSGCVWDVEFGAPHDQRCAREDAYVRCATVAEVEEYLGEDTRTEDERDRGREDRADTERDAKRENESVDE